MLIQSGDYQLNRQFVNEIYSQIENLGIFQFKQLIDHIVRCGKNNFILTTCWLSVYRYIDLHSIISIIELHNYAFLESVHSSILHE